MQALATENIPYIFLKPEIGIVILKAPTIIYTFVFPKCKDSPCSMFKKSASEAMLHSVSNFFRIIIRYRLQKTMLVKKRKKCQNHLEVGLYKFWPRVGK